MASRARWIVRAAAVTLVGGAAAVAVAAPAHAAAATLDIVGSSAYYIAGSGQLNHLILQRSTTNPDQYIFQEVGGQSITSTDPACFYPTPGSTAAMTCTAPGLLYLVVSLGDGNDAVVNWTDRQVYLYGGDGNDALWFGGRTGTTGWADGGAGDDVLISGPGNDTMVGGAGSDTASYYKSMDPVTASLITKTGGRSYDTDTYNGIENLDGGGGNDILYGDGHGNRLFGGVGELCRAYPFGCQEYSGNDTIFGNGGADVIGGGLGNDTVLGGDGNDDLWGDEGDDGLYGEAGNDTLHGGPGLNYLHGGSGTDSCWEGTKVQCEN